MVEFDVDMGYLEDADELDCVILHDENGEMGDMMFIPHRICSIKLKQWSGWHCSSCGELATLTGSDETFRNLNFCPACGAEVVHRGW